MLYDPKWELDTVGRILISAADYMQQHGWCRGYLNKDDDVCLLGAIQAVDFEADEECDAYLCLEKVIGEAPTYWNDTVCQSKEQAISVLRKAAQWRGL